MSRHIALIGYPLGHSISPLFQQAALDHYQLNVRYEAWEIEPAQLENTVELLRHPTNLGANVTIPYKEAVLPLLDQLEELASHIGAVNTIVNREGKLIGYNTDALAFLQALREDGGFEPEGKRALLLGAGGVARAAGFILTRAGVKTIIIVNRTLKRAETLASSLREREPGIEVITLPWEGPELEEALSHCHLVVNCTSIGMKHSPAEEESPLKDRSLPKDVLVYDLVYNPVETPLLREARKSGARTLGGIAMLVYQGAAAFELWTHRQAPLDIMLKAAREALG